MTNSPSQHSNEMLAVSHFTDRFLYTQVTRFNARGRFDISSLKCLFFCFSNPRFLFSCALIWVARYENFGPPPAVALGLLGMLSVCSQIKVEVRHTTFREQHPRSHHKGATGTVRTGDQRYPVLCQCQLGQLEGKYLRHQFLHLLTNHRVFGNQCLRWM